MNLKSIVLFAAILFIAGISFGIPMILSGGRIKDTHPGDLLLVTISPSATQSTAQVQTKQAFAQMFFSPTASFTVTASLQPSETPIPTATLEDTTTPSATSTFTATPSATQPYITLTSRPDKKSTSIPPTPVPPSSTPHPTSTEKPRPTKTPVPTNPPTSTEPPATQPTTYP